MKHRFFSLFLTILLLCTILPITPSAGAAAYRKSGSLDMDKLSRREIAQLLSDAPMDYAGQIYETRPNVTAPYSAGKLSDKVLKAAEARLSALRRLAGLDPVALDGEMVQNSQICAVLMAALGDISHYPGRPENMADDFYKTGYTNAGRSNLSAGFPLVTSIDCFMDDTDVYNISVLGHRRWQLNPTLSKVGFGYAEAGTYYGFFAAVDIFDDSGRMPDYDFISWPSSGFFPSNTLSFTAESAWSVTLNPAQYRTPVRSEITVTLTEKETGKSWVFTNSDSSNATNKKYFNVDNQYYGVPNAIIFRPDGISAYKGVYYVHIDGLKTRSGYDVSDFDFRVSFFDASDPASVEGNPFTDVTDTDWFYDSVLWAVDEEITTGTSKTTFSPADKCTRAQVLTFLWRAMGEPEPSSSHNPFSDVSESDWFYKAALWAYENNMNEGMDADRFNPSDICPREHIILFLWRYAGMPAVETDTEFSDIDRKSAVGSAVAWAVEAGITKGTGNGLFSPQDPCDRGQVVTFLKRVSS